MIARKRYWIVAAASAASSFACAQIPDLMNALDAGGRAMGMGGGTYASDANTLSTAYNPAGLAFVADPTMSVVFRNLPESDNRFRGDFRNPTYDTSNFVGSRAISHFGLAMPLKGAGGRENGAIGLSYTVGGYVRDFAHGAGLADGALTVDSYSELLESKTDLFTVAWGKSLNHSTNVGAGLVVANQYVRDDRYVTYTDTGILPTTTQLSGNGNGIGAIAGVQYTPPATPNLMLGLSVRTPIKLKDNDDTKPYIDTIPGRLSGGFAARTDSIRGTQDFLVYGAQVDYYFGGERDAVLSRKNYATVGGGVEYNLARWNARIPIRLGFNAVPSGGDGFSSRNALTFGIGYRPENGDYAVDLNFASPEQGGQMDIALALTYKIGKK